ncbi:MAG: hypothetical protein JWM47_2745 [Acidimicrobiales bacterium]|nr:hypothetical protein [Acidimicrobiales bacterium]
MTELESGFRIADVIELLRRRFPIMLAAGLIGLVAGYLAFAAAPPSYSATSRVQVQAQDVASGTDGKPEVDLATERDLVKSDAVGDAVRKQLKLAGTNRGLFADLTVTSKEDSLVLELTYVSPSATRARDVANAVADAYLADRLREAADSQRAALGRLDQQISDARDAVTEATKLVDQTPAGSTERSLAQAQLAEARTTSNSLIERRSTLAGIDTTTVGKIVRKAPLPDSVLSKMAVGTGVGVFGLCLLVGLAVALFVDRGDSLGGGRRQVELMAPDTNIRILPTATGRKPSVVEIDAAIDRLALELAGQGAKGRAASVLIAGTGIEPPVALAEELAASLAFAGIPTLFVLAGSATREVPQAVKVTSFTDLITGPSITGPASLPDRAGAVATSSRPSVVWLQPRGSTESSGLLRRAVVEALVTRAGREGFEAVVFVAGTPLRNAAAAALGPWVTKTAVIVEHDAASAAVETVRALQEAGVTLTEVVWT